MYVRKVVLPLVRGALLSHKERMLHNHSEKAVNAVVSSGETPPTWDHSQEKMVELMPVPTASLEWEKVETLLHSTLPQAEIVKLERIQNKWLWDAYYRSKERIYQKNAGQVNELQLFHGTSHTPPEKIYGSEKGFDFRFSGTGMWGEGAYFAVNAKYSNNYAYKTPTNVAGDNTATGEQKQIFVAQVLTGFSARIPHNRFLKKPPVITESPDTSGIVTIFKEQRYDSVRGETGGSHIYVVYEHDKAYLEYLLTYQLKDAKQSGTSMW